jgi:hypothetical protein
MGEFVRDLLPDPVAYFEAEGLKPQGKGKWRTTECKFHGGSDSMRINPLTGAWVCMACGVKAGDVLGYHMQFHGLDFVEASKALGAWDDAGKPSRPQRPTPLPARAALEILLQEATLVAVAAANVAHGVVLSDEDLTRLLLAVGRVNRIREVFHG